MVPFAHLTVQALHKKGRVKTSAGTLFVCACECMCNEAAKGTESSGMARESTRPSEKERANNKNEDKGEREKEMNPALKGGLD